MRIHRGQTRRADYGQGDSRANIPPVLGCLNNISTFSHLPTFYEQKGIKIESCFSKKFQLLGDSFSRPLPGLRPWTSLGDFRLPDPPPTIRQTSRLRYVYGPGPYLTCFLHFLLFDDAF